MPRYAALQRAHRAALMLVVVAPAVLRAQTRPSGFATDRLARIDRVMQQYVDSGQIGGAVGLVLEDGRVVFRHAVGWLDNGGGTPDDQRRVVSYRVADEGHYDGGDPVARGRGK